MGRVVAVAYTSIAFLVVACRGGPNRDQAVVVTVWLVEVQRSGIIRDRTAPAKACPMVLPCTIQREANCIPRRGCFHRLPGREGATLQHRDGYCRKRYTDNDHRNAYSNIGIDRSNGPFHAEHLMTRRRLDASELRGLVKALLRITITRFMVVSITNWFSC